MNGPQHYAEAERLLSAASDIWLEAEDGSISEAGYIVSEAQVHATLALVAAHISAADQGADQMTWPGHEWVETAVSPA